MSAAVTNGYTNGASANALNGVPTSKRFSDVPNVLDIPVHGQEDEAVEIDLTSLVDDPTDLCDLFETEQAARTYWMSVALAYAKLKRVDYAIDILIRGGNVMQNINPRDKLSMVSCLCWMYLWKSREAPRVAPEGQLISEAKTKDYYLQLATQTLNEASRINPAFPPLFLARGVLYLLRASLQAPAKTGGANAIDPEKAELSRSALKSFEDAIRVSQGKNMLAVMGKARASYSLTKYAEALASYQEVLQKAPNLVDPDPRIGIGCCFWQLGYKDDAKQAWERAREIAPDNKVANILLGLFLLDSSGHVPTNSPEFLKLYKQAMTEYTQKAFKLDKDMPLTCSTFASYFLSRKNYANVDSLAHKAIQHTDVNAIASDGWYLLARKEHYSGNADKAADYYKRADDARGGDQRGYLPAKFGAAQLLVMKNDLANAKYHLDRIIKQSRNTEAMSLLGTIYAEEVFAIQNAAVKEDKTVEAKAAIVLLESVRTAWKDPKKHVSPDASVLLNLARLYEIDHPDKALLCLQQVEQMELDQVPESAHLTNGEDVRTRTLALRKNLPPQLLNNIGCFYHQNEKYEMSSELLEAALGACAEADQNDLEQDTEALITTITYNLGRSYEARGMVEEALSVYGKLAERDPDYTDMQIRLAYINLRRKPSKEGPDAIAKLYQDNPSDLEVRALYGWFLSKLSKKKLSNVQEDAEFRLYKHTLQNYDKHDRYALIGMGNLWSMSAREMRRETDAEKLKRSVTYGRAVEFFDKALLLDAKNAYAAQGIAIALAEDKKDFKAALQVFLQVKETVKDAHVYINLGHIYAELQQFSKAIESYTTALAKDNKGGDAGIMACLGRVWLNKGRASQARGSQQTKPDLTAFYEALACAKQCYEIAPDQAHFKFNVAFVQIQLASTIYSMKEAERSLSQLEEASHGLDNAITALDELANEPQPPYPKNSIEQRANMARNTQTKQLERAIASQKEYEEKNKERITAALEQRKFEEQRRDLARAEATRAETERKDKIRKQREEIAARDRQHAEQRALEEKEMREDRERAKQDAMDLVETDPETGEKVVIKKKRKAPTTSAKGGKKKTITKGGYETGGDDDDDSDLPDGNGDEAGEQSSAPRKKKRRLEKKSNGSGGGSSSSKKAKPLPSKSSKYKSAEMVVDSDSDDENRNGAGGDARDSSLSAPPTPRAGGTSDVDDDDDDGAGRGHADEPVAVAAPTKRARRTRIVDDDDDDEEEDEKDGEAGGGGATAAAEGTSAVQADTTMPDLDDEE